MSEAYYLIFALLFGAVLLGLLLGWLLIPLMAKLYTDHIHRDYVRRMQRENSANRQNEIEGIVQKTRRERENKQSSDSSDRN